MRPNATIVSAANATLSLSTNEMTKTPVSYTFSVVTAQPLGFHQLGQSQPHCLRLQIDHALLWHQHRPQLASGHCSCRPASVG